MILIGSGALHAREEILELAEMIDAPVVAFRSGRGIVSDAHELGLTMAAAYKLWPNTDLMIGIGTRMELPASGFRWPTSRRARNPFVSTSTRWKCTGLCPTPPWSRTPGPAPPIWSRP